jgi:hypothetical protein
MRTEEKIWSWYNIAQYFEVHESTVKRWAREEPSFRVLVRRWRHRIFAYRSDLEQWRRQMEHGLCEEAATSQADTRL